MPLGISKIERLEVYCNQEKVGVLALTHENLCAFQYDAAFLQNGFSISPFHLPLERKVFVAKPNPFSGNFGVFNDSLPDGWGSLLLDRYLKKNGIEVDKLNKLQRLAIIGSSGRGALEYVPDWSITEKATTHDLNILAKDAEKILLTKYHGNGLDILFKNGASSGGARPKVFLKIKNEEWLIKFKSSADPPNIGKTEYDYSILAQQCGIKMPLTCLFEKRYFGVQRFDRNATKRIHTISAAGLLNADYRIPSLDYEMLLRACFLLTKNMEEVLQLYRIMVFNVAIGNKDDHAKNFSFQFENGQWKLSPAYDLLPSSGFNGNHTTTINGKGTPDEEDLLIVAKKIGIAERTACSIKKEIYALCRK